MDIDSKSKRVVKITRDLGGEMYYSMNFSFILNDCSDEEIDVVEKIVKRAMQSRMMINKHLEEKNNSKKKEE